MLTGKYRLGEVGRKEGFGGRVFQPENSTQRTQILDAVIDLAEKLNATPSQIAVAWAGSHGAIPIIGPRSLMQLKDNLGAVNIELTNEQLNLLNSVSNIR